jgi:hypothetical protein
MTTKVEPADARIVGIVRWALRRDLRRTRTALAAEPYPRGGQRRALGEHVVWMMELPAPAPRR